jgi:hypothetical protein
MLYCSAGRCPQGVLAGRQPKRGSPRQRPSKVPDVPAVPPHLAMWGGACGCHGAKRYVRFLCDHGEEGRLKNERGTRRGAA